MSQINAGGRWRKAPYETKLIRVPCPLEAQVDKLKLLYIEFLEAGGNPQQPTNYLLNKKVVNKNNDEIYLYLVNALNKLVNKIKSRESGYKGNSASQLIKELIELENLIQLSNKKLE